VPSSTAAETPPRRWLKPGIAGLLAVLLIAVAGFTFGGSKAALRSFKAFSKDPRGLMGSPDFQFIGQGRIVGGSGDTWLVEGVPLQVDDHTQIVGELHAGDFVSLSGRILRNGAWLADHIEPGEAKEATFTFNGPLEALAEGAWVIGGKSLRVNAQTQVDSGLAVNDLLLVTFTPLEDGTWQAVKIERFDAPWIEPTPTPTLTPVPTETETPVKLAPAKAPKAIEIHPKKPKSPSHSYDHPGKEVEHDHDNHGDGHGGEEGDGEGDED